ncbi:hypothetical protein PMI14_05735 [Acidovorax sp. CF316]|uniref:hypothetical protein n=1 Tax=Acidovorax sp. CF316 TaxID=1144317 RepID=UPI00026BEF41|nr:hypothetical protein [Acidovorax sp. CF316]EJE49730.1 hypothetical protein PMI14_05735 [Acidovorax sp. CF316]
MPMEFMLELSQGELPRTVDDARGIDCLRVLAAANLVQAVLPEVGGTLQSAQVLAITAEGRAALRKAYPERDFHFLPTSLFPRWLPTPQAPGGLPRQHDATDSGLGPL